MTNLLKSVILSSLFVTTTGHKAGVHGQVPDPTKNPGGFVAYQCQNAQDTNMGTYPRRPGKIVLLLCAADVEYLNYAYAEVDSKDDVPAVGDMVIIDVPKYGPRRYNIAARTQRFLDKRITYVLVGTHMPPP